MQVATTQRDPSSARRQALQDPMSKAFAIDERLDFRSATFVPTKREFHPERRAIGRSGHLVLHQALGVLRAAAGDLGAGCTLVAPLQSHLEVVNREERDLQRLVSKRQLGEVRRVLLAGKVGFEIAQGDLHLRGRLIGGEVAARHVRAGNHLVAPGFAAGLGDLKLSSLQFPGAGVCIQLLPARIEREV